MLCKRFSYGHIAVSITRGSQIASEVGCISSNECNRWLARTAKTRQREVLLEDAADDDLQVEPAHTVPTEGWRVDLEQAIAALPDENRVAVSISI